MTEQETVELILAPTADPARVLKVDRCAPLRESSIEYVVGLFRGLRHRARNTGLVPAADWGSSQVWGSGSNCRLPVCINGWAEFLSETGTERAVVDRAAKRGFACKPSSTRVTRFLTT
jgi:hypothetical protein